MADTIPLTKPSQVLFKAFGFNDKDNDNAIEKDVKGEGYDKCKECDLNGDQRITVDEAWNRYFNNISSYPHITASLKKEAGFRNPLEISKEMANYVKKHVMPFRKTDDFPDSMIAELLFHCLIGKGKENINGIEFAPLEVKGDSDSKKRPKGALTAADVFRGKDGNRYALCLEYSFLYVALARQAGLDAGLVDVIKDIDKKPVAHMCAVVRPGFSPLSPLDNPLQGDILVDPGYVIFNARHKEVRVMSDAEALAAFYSNSGNTLVENGKLEEGKQSLLTAIEIDPDARFAHAGLGNVYLKEDHVGLAVDEYNASTKVNPSFCKPYYLLSDIYYAQDEICKSFGYLVDGIVCSVRNF